MAFPTRYRKSGDIRPPVDAVLERPSEDGVVDISGASSIALYAHDPSGTLELDGVSASMTTDGTDGAVEYSVTSGDFAADGEYDVEWEVDWDGAGDTERFPKKSYQKVYVETELA